MASSSALALSIFLCLLSTGSAVKVNAKDSAALLAIKKAFTSYGTANLNTWAPNQDSSKWFGVRFNKLGRATSLSLPSRKLKGTISPRIGDLTELVDVDLSSNGLTSSIPSSFGKLRKIKNIYLQFNSLTGVVPRVFASLPVLVSLRLDHNILYGYIDRDFKSGAIKLVNYVGNYHSGPGFVKKNLRVLCGKVQNATRGMKLAKNCLSMYSFKQPCFAFQRSSGSCKAFCNAYQFYGPCNGNGTCVSAGGSNRKCNCFPGRKLDPKDKFRCI